MTQEIKELEQAFAGVGEVKGFLFKQVLNNGRAYIYSVEGASGIRYEVFERRINTRFNCVSYPTSASFGVWAWSTKSLDRAKEKAEQL